MNQPFPILIAGPSGVGKSTIIKAVLERFRELRPFKTTTTRPPRAGGEDRYHFVSPEEFEQLIAEGKMLEWAKVHGNYYGAQKAHVQEILDQGKFPMPVNAVDVQGVRTYKKLFPNALTIFVTYESLEELPKRIRTTRPEATETEIATRLMSAQQEMAAAGEYEHIIVNREGHLQQTVEEVAGIISTKIQARRNS